MTKLQIRLDFAWQRSVGGRAERNALHTPDGCLPGLGSVGRGIVPGVPWRPDMTIEAISTADIRADAGASRAAKTLPTKAAIVAKLLTRAKGGTLAEIAKATDWQPHSCRAFLTGLRKKGKVLVKEQRADGAVAYRIADGEAVAS
jgi:hypothetical protein